MILSDGWGLPLAADVADANTSEGELIETLIDERVLQNRQSPRLIYDRAADSNELRARMYDRGIDLISPHRKNRKRFGRQDGRKLRRYRKRWKIERSISWLQNFRRLVVRWDYHDYLFKGFLQLACMFIILRQF